jgi:hypothetical protein
LFITLPSRACKTKSRASSNPSSSDAIRYDAAPGGTATVGCALSICHSERVWNLLVEESLRRISRTP